MQRSNNTNAFSDSFRVRSRPRRIRSTRTINLGSSDMEDEESLRISSLRRSLGNLELSSSDRLGISGLSTSDRMGKSGSQMDMSGSDRSSSSRRGDHFYLARKSSMAKPSDGLGVPPSKEQPEVGYDKPPEGEKEEAPKFITFRRRKPSMRMQRRSTMGF